MRILDGHGCFLLWREDLAALSMLRFFPRTYLIVLDAVLSKRFLLFDVVSR